MKALLKCSASLSPADAGPVQVVEEPVQVVEEKERLNQGCTVDYVDHVGVAVRDIEEALAFFQDTFASKDRQVKDMGDQGVRAALVEIGQTRLELLQPLGAETPVGRFLERRGEGLHHLAFNVKDVSGSPGNH